MKYNVYTTWSMAAVVEVEAQTLEEAIAKVENDEVIVNVDEDGEYVDNSFEVVREVSDGFN
jgi:hypothetical protein